MYGMKLNIRKKYHLHLCEKTPAAIHSSQQLFFNMSAKKTHDLHYYPHSLNVVIKATR